MFGRLAALPSWSAGAEDRTSVPPPVHPNRCAHSPRTPTTTLRPRPSVGPFVTFWVVVSTGNFFLNAFFFSPLTFFRSSIVGAGLLHISVGPSRFAFPGQTGVRDQPHGGSKSRLGGRTNTRKDLQLYYVVVTVAPLHSSIHNKPPECSFNRKTQKRLRKNEFQYTLLLNAVRCMQRQQQNCKTQRKPKMLH
ncbi:unnamed protein product [Macrosiphum euphorbiae]|uniref:Uncharacterized protein n=1 Tax=Macrosiphum euphorbiae TaxID=13131 RepID=A0AAV0XBA0_9HEMI|nr:unnamed protein product [Macrosiphum euphorbiae]